MGAAYFPGPEHKDVAAVAPPTSSETPYVSPGTLTGRHRAPQATEEESLREESNLAQVTDRGAWV